MKTIVMAAVFVLLLCEAAMPGVLYGRIIREDGKALARTAIKIENDSVTTNGFGGYEVRLPDGIRALTFHIKSSAGNWDVYTTDSIKIYSPKVKQNWKMSRDRQSGALKLEKVR
jgi:hypothetical protein